MTRAAQPTLPGHASSPTKRLSAFAKACQAYPTVTGPRTERWSATLLIPGLRLVSEANAHEHYRARVRRAEQQHAIVRAALSSGWSASGGRRLCVPVEVTIVRVAPRRMDSDNVVGACKHVRDSIAAWLGIDDNREDLVTYRVEQARGEHGVRITLRSVGDEP